MTEKESPMKFNLAQDWANPKSFNEKSLDWLDKLTWRVTLITLAIALPYFAYHIISAINAGRL